MSNCLVPMPTYERPEPVGELVDSLKRENDALKQLVRDLWEGFECDRCPLYGDDCWWKQGDELKPCRMMNRMRGLGIEVDE